MENGCPQSDGNLHGRPVAQLQTKNHIMKEVLYGTEWNNNSIHSR